MKRSSSTAVKVHRILICEDNLDQLHSLALILKEMGHSVDFAINGYVAYDAIRRFRPDTIILDLGLPGVTGFEVAQQIRMDPELQGVRLFAFTAYDDEKYKKRAEECGFDGYYVKPVDPKVIYELFGDTKDGFTGL
jgi:DNA-binding response OmpR family regulator